MPPLSVMAAEAKRKFKAAPAKKSEPPKNIFKSTEKVAESDLDSETESDSDSDSELEPPKPAPVIVKRTGNSASKKTVSPSSSSGSEEDVDDSDSSEGHTSGSGSSSGEEEESVVEVEVSPEIVTIGALPLKTATNLAVIASVPQKKVPPFIPPAGFEPITIDKGAEATASRFLNGQNLDGKQVWYITAPASVPMSALKRVSWYDVQKSLPSIHLNGQNYGFVQDRVEGKGLANLMVPNGSKYCLAKRHIDQKLRLQQIVQLSTLSNSCSAQSSSAHARNGSTVLSKKSVRQQPEGLKMRFLPIGTIPTDSVVTGVSKTSQNTGKSNKDGDMEMEDPPSTFQMPLGQFDIESGRGSSNEDENDDDDEELPTTSKPLATAASESSSDSDEFSVDSEEEKLTKRKPPQAHSNGAQPSLKRKLNDMQNDSASRLSQLPHFNGAQLKSPKTRHSKSPAVTPALSEHSKPNGTPASAMPSPIFKKAPQDVELSLRPPPRSSINRPSPSPSTAVKGMLVPPPSSISPPSRSIPSYHSLTVPSSKSLSRKSLQPAKSPGLHLEKENGHPLEGEIEALDPFLADEQRRKQTKRLTSNALSRKYKTKVSERSTDNSEPGMRGRLVDTQVSSQTMQPSSVTQPLPSPGPLTSVSQDEILPSASKKKTRTVKRTKDGLTAKVSKQNWSTTPILPPRTIPAILPLKKNMTVTK